MVFSTAGFLRNHFSTLLDDAIGAFDGRPVGEECGADDVPLILVRDEAGGRLLHESRQVEEQCSEDGSPITTAKRIVTRTAARVPVVSVEGRIEPLEER
jgi:hypothetical protein